MQRRRTDDEDQQPWEPPEGRGLVAAPFVADDTDEPPDPERPGADRESRRMLRATVFVIVLAMIGTVFFVQLGLRLSR